MLVSVQDPLRVSQAYTHTFPGLRLQFAAQILLMFVT